MTGKIMMLTWSVEMTTSDDRFREYWDKRYSDEGEIWGGKPSATAGYALKLFEEVGVTSLLVPGSGYGRHTRFFSEHNLAVTGIEISPAAVEMARRFDPHSRFYTGSALDMSFYKDKYDAVYCFNVLHLFLEQERRLMIKQCQNRLKPGGRMFFSVFSEKEDDFGKGKEVEPNTFESKPGRPAHYFTEEDLKEHFRDFNIIGSGIIEDPEDHGGKAHVHILRFIYFKAKGRV
jgi:SAM-dependent methyltransferase